MSVLGPPNYNLSHKASKWLIYKGLLIRNGSFETLTEILKSDSKIFGMGTPPSPHPRPGTILNAKHWNLLEFIQQNQCFDEETLVLLHKTNVLHAKH